jgi:hypothetical protein
MYDYPAEGTPPWGARRPASPADPVPPVEHHDPKVGERRPRSKQGQPRVQMHPRLNSEGAASFASRLCEAKWRRGVGRQARQSGGEL